MNQSAMMMLLSGLVGLLLVLTAEARVGYSSRSGVCSETEQCLLFDLICKTEDFEVRHYESAKWASTIETASSIGTAFVNGFKRVDEYFNGANENGAKIHMPEHVGIRIPNETTWETAVYDVIGLLPLEYQETSPPTPTDDNIYIVDSAESNVYVRGFDGLVTSQSERDTAQSLASDLDSVGANYEKSSYFVATYGSPLSLADSRSEVLFFALGEPVCI
ncbi:heme-binding protein 2-like isoform X1 [Hippoglossus hippoglossus]|uniref:heme-binding protein 2-like isoform X1 n=1 Tax=Hippoglossus hippoglossus TaxID=8267 RepID=UPI00148D3474|nr:heme-binding protein 2-like isoform X1 [Hippoglossus hippoglossus]